MLVTAGPKPRAARRPQVSTSQEPESSPQTLEDVLRGKRLVVVVGNGGVGKTSTSAAIACARARRGEDVGVLTIDPAPRLGDALGLSGLEETPRHVALPSPSLGQLRAMRLDSKGTLDRMVDRYADSPTAALALRQHPIYLALAGQLGGAENYAAFQRLHELVEDGLYDCLVVDTPPALHASDLLAAPARLSSLMGGSALSFLADPARVAARAGGTLARATVSLVLAAVERVTGTSLQKELSRFVELFTGLASGLERRTRDIDRLLRDPSTAFVLVTRPRRRDIQEALRFRESLAKVGIEVAGIVVNRLTPAAGRHAETQRGRAEFPHARVTWRHRRDGSRNECAASTGRPGHGGSPRGVGGGAKRATPSTKSRVPTPRPRRRRGIVGRHCRTSRKPRRLAHRTAPTRTRPPKLRSVVCACDAPAKDWSRRASRSLPANDRACAKDSRASPA